MAKRMSKNVTVAEDKRISAFASLLRGAYRLSGALPDFEEACKRSGVPYTAFARPGMVHCYCMLPYFREAREDFDRLTEILKK